MQKFRRRGAAVGVAASLSVLSVVASPALGQTASAKPPAAQECAWMDTSLSADERAELLLEASSLEQKFRWLNEQAAITPQATTFGGVEYVPQLDCTPTIVYANGPEGLHSTEGATAWPSPIAIAATFNEDLAEVKGAMMAAESFDNGNGVLLGPGMAGGRTPLSGRTPEYFGEDPVLSGVLGASTIRGMEDGNPDKRVVANPKHFVANEQEWDREASSSNVDERTLEELYTLPFEIAIREGDPDSLMCSYNQINGVWACENPIMNEDLKDRIGFNGYIMSDFGAVHSTADALNAGLDQELNRPIWFTPENLQAALDAGEITEDTIDAAAFRVVRAFFNVGLFDNPVPNEPTGPLTSDEHKAVARELAEQSSVLLKNDGVLPLADGQTVAVFGPTASVAPSDDPKYDGPTAYDACSGGFRLDLGFFVIERAVLDCSALVDPLTAITERVEAAGGTVVYDDGADLGSAAAAAADADVAIVFGHINMGEFSDRADLNLDHDGDALVEAVAAAADNTVVVLNSGSAVMMPWIDDVQGVIQSWYAGEQFGPALAGMLSGDVNPSGKLPMTFPKAIADTPTGGSDAQYPGLLPDGSLERPEGDESIRQVDYSEGLKIGYRWYEAEGIDPLFAFGHGLSYTDFEYSKVKVTPNNNDGSKAVRVSFRITNTGDVAGTDVAQVYADLPESADLPSHRLVGWERVTLEPGQHKNVTIELTRDQLDTRHLLQVWDVEEDAWVTPTGTVEFSVGGSSVDLSSPVSMNVR